MGADGHIAIYDYKKVKKIEKEINSHIKEENKKVSFPGYICYWKCNGKQACLIYWGDSPYSGEGYWEIGNGSYDGEEPTKEWLEFEKRCDAEALIVKDQEVWT